MKSSPEVSVIMSVYNGERFLAEAVESILAQTFRDFEFLIINDGSTDGTAEILAHYAEQDSRIRILDQENQGLIASLNRGWKEARGQFIARMDADDISVPNRFEKQVQYLDKHPEVGVVGSWMDRIDEEGKSLGMGWEVPSTPGEVRWGLLFGSCLVHPSTMIRKECLQSVDGYNPDAIHVEDYDLWARISKKTNISNIPESLVLHRVWSSSICSTQNDVQETGIAKISVGLLSDLLCCSIPKQIQSSLRQIHQRKTLQSKDSVLETLKFLTAIYRKFILSHRLEFKEKSNVSYDYARKCCTLATSSLKQKNLISAVFIFIRALSVSPHQLPVRMIKSLVRRQSSAEND